MSIGHEQCSRESDKYLSAGGSLFHPVPRLDAPDKLWLLPAPVAKWLGGGITSGPVAAYALPLVTGAPLADGFTSPPVLLVWCVGIVVGCVGAFVRPGGLDLGQWAQAWLRYQVTPRRAVWWPVAVEEGRTK